MIAFYADENVDARIVDGLRRRGVDVLTAREAGLTGRIDDEKHLVFATSQGRALITGDSDLLSIAERWATAARSHAGIVYWHPARCSVGHLVRIVHHLAQAETIEAIADRVTYASWDVKQR